LYGIPDSTVERKTYLPLLEHLKDKHPERNYLTSYRAFSILNAKSEAIVVRDVFVKMLMTTRGLGVEKAAEIARLFGTPRALFSALEEAGDKAPELVSRASASNIVRKRVGSSLSTRVANIWYSDDYT
jgi:crossover junction endonuclease MUS81